MKCILSERLLSPYKVFHKIICIEMSLSIFYCTHPVWMLMSDRWVAGRRQSGLTVHAVKHITEIESARSVDSSDKGTIKAPKHPSSVLFKFAYIFQTLPTKVFRKLIQRILIYKILLMA